MKAIGKDIGNALDVMYAQIERRLRTESDRALSLEPFDGGAFSNLDWRPDAVVVQLHNGVPTHALPHVLGVALQHVRQRLDLYPGVLRPPQDFAGGSLIRSALRELLMGPEAEMHLAPLNLDRTWESEQRHAGLKEMLRDASAEWDQEGHGGFAFAALQYGRFSLEHPEELWEPLRGQFQEQLPKAAEVGERVVKAVQQSGWKTPGGCLQSLVAVRELLRLRTFAVIEDRQRGQRI